MNEETVNRNVDKGSDSYKRGWAKVGATINNPIEKDFDFSYFQSNVKKVEVKRVEPKPEVKSEMFMEHSISKAITKEATNPIMALKIELVRVKNTNPVRAREIFVELKALGAI